MCFFLPTSLMLPFSFSPCLFGQFIQIHSLLHPTKHFTDSDVSELHNNCRSTDFKALSLPCIGSGMPQAQGFESACSLRPFFTCNPTENFTTSRPKNMVLDISELHKIRWFKGFEALELRNVRSRSFCPHAGSQRVNQSDASWRNWTHESASLASGPLSLRETRE